MSVPTTQTAIQMADKIFTSWLDNLRVVKDVPTPTPGPGEVLVNITLRPINPADVFTCMNVYPAFNPASYPAVPGGEGMGTVAALGEGVSGWAVGQRVTAARWPSFAGGQGTYQEFLTVPASELVAIPDDIPDDAAACAVINPFTVVGMIELLGPLTSEDSIIITAAGSALGRMAIALCKDRGVQSICVVRRAALVDELSALGASIVILESDDLVANVKKFTGGKGATAALDCMCGDTTSKLCYAVKVGGTVVLYGGMSGLTFSASLVETLFRGTTIKGYWYLIEADSMTAEQKAERMRTIFDLFRRGVFKSGAAQTLLLEQVVDGFKAHLEDGRPGKVMLASPPFAH